MSDDVSEQEGIDPVLEAILRALWEHAREAGGDLSLAQSVNASLYFLLSAIREDWPFGLSPGGLASSDYFGHV